jgi:hypothetical protein
METSQEDRSKMHDQLNDHETRISILENKEWFYEDIKRNNSKNNNAIDSNN